MDLEKFTERSRGFLQAAQTSAQNSGHQRLEPIHLLKALIDDPEGLAANLVKAAGGDADKLRRDTESALAKLPKVEGSGAGQLYLAPELGKVLKQAETLAKEAGDSYVTVERLLVALALANGTSAESALSRAGVNSQSLNHAINDFRQGRKAESPNARTATTH